MFLAADVASVSSFWELVSWADCIVCHHLYENILNNAGEKITRAMFTLLVHQLVNVYYFSPLIDILNASLWNLAVGLYCNAVETLVTFPNDQKNLNAKPAT